MYFVVLETTDCVVLIEFPRGIGYQIKMNRGVSSFDFQHL